MATWGPFLLAVALLADENQLATRETSDDGRPARLIIGPIACPFM